MTARRSWRGLRPETRDSWVVCLGTLLVYLVLHREALHPPDAHRYLQQVCVGDTDTHHFLYLRTAVGLGKVTGALGLNVFASMLLLSALGGSIAALAAHRALLQLGLPRHRAHVGAWMVAVSPGVFYFATTVEIHAPFVGLANLALWSATVVGRSRHSLDLSGAMRTGVLVALCTGMHATGHLVLAPIAALFWLRGRPFRETLLVVAAHGLTIWALAWIVTGGTQYLRSSGGWLTLASWQLDAPTIASVLWNEWLLALLPASMLALLSWGRSQRRCTLLVHAALVPYLAASCAILHGVSERGAYVLPMALPLAWLAARTVPVKWCVLASVLGLGVSLQQAGPLRQDPAAAAYAQDALALDAIDRLHVYVGTLAEADAMGRGAPSVQSSAIGILGPVRTMADEYYPALCASWESSLAQVRAGGRRPVFTPAALEFLRAEPGGLLSRMMREHVDPRYTWHLVEHGSFRGFEPRVE